MALTLATSGKTVLDNFKSEVNIYKNVKVAIQTTGYTGGHVDIVKGNPGEEVASGTEFEVKATADQGYKFIKWSDGATDNPYAFTVGLDDIDLKAEFAEAGKFNITFKLDDGWTYTQVLTEASTIMPAFGAANGKLNAERKDAYAEVKWYDADNNEITGNELMPDHDWELTGKYTLNVFKLTYDLAGGTVATENPATYTYETADITLNNPTKEGYTFYGWTGTDLTEATKTVKIVKGSTGDKSYTATWKAIEYAITYDLDGGELAEGVTNPEKYTIETETFTLNNPAKTGYKFLGWTGGAYTDPTETVTVEKGSTGELSFKANWQINKYKVTFKDYDGTVLVAEAEYDYDSDLTAVAPDMTGKTNNDGAPFTTWDNDYNGKVPANDVVYTAVYGGSFTITFMRDGEAIQTSEEIEYNTDINVSAPALAEKEGYTNNGWKDQEGKAFGEYTKMPAKNLVYTEDYTINQYTMTFVLGNGEENVVKTQDYATELETPADPARTGYTFKGWEPEVPATIPAEDKTFTAQWEIINYTITYAGLEDATVSGNPETYNVETADITLAAPAKTGYTFKGWTGTDLTEATTEVTIAKGSTGNREYTATWEVNKHKLTFVYWKSADDEAISTVEMEVEYGTNIKEALATTDFSEETTTNDGLPFAAWDPEITDDMTMADADMTFTAIYSGDFTITFIDENGKTIHVFTVTIPADMPEPIAMPNKTGYNGVWIETTEGKEYSEYEKMPAKDLTFKTVYSKKTGIYIAFQMPDGSILQDAYMTFGDKITKPADPTLEGYVFTGWDPEVPATCPAENTYFVAQFVEDPTVGIRAIMGNATAATVYTLQGALVGRDMTAEKVAALRSGIYVINGKKVVIK